MKKRLQTLGAALMLCTAPLFAEDFAVDGIYYNILSEAYKTVEVTYCGNSPEAIANEYSGSVTIPKTVTYNKNTYSVTSIGYGAFYECSSLTSITIPDNVTTIGEIAFNNCHNLMFVTIPNSIRTIEYRTFEACHNLTSITIPNSVIKIGEGAFAYCHNLTCIAFPSSVLSIEYNAFAFCSKLMSIIIPNNVTSIGNGAFYGCSDSATATVGCSWKTNPLYYFALEVTVNPTLHNYENGICTVCGEKETTGINNTMVGNHLPAFIYDLQGRRVSNAGKGLYIVNGKKVLVK